MNIIDIKVELLTMIGFLSMIGTGDALPKVGLN